MLDLKSNAMPGVTEISKVEFYLLQIDKDISRGPFLEISTTVTQNYC